MPDDPLALAGEKQYLTVIILTLVAELDVCCPRIGPIGQVNASISMIEVTSQVDSDLDQDA